MLPTTGRRALHSAAAIAVAAGLALASRGAAHAVVPDRHQPGSIALVDASGSAGAARHAGWAQRTLDLAAGQGGISAAALSVRGPRPGGALVRVDTCPRPWVPSGSGFACDGASTVLASEALAAASVALPGFTLAPGGLAHLRLTFTDPAGTDPAGPDAASTALDASAYDVTAVASAR